jgi:hypothetical protein
VALLRSATARRFIQSVTSGVFSNFRDGLESPAQLPGMATWYDASDLSTMRNDAGNVPASGDSIKLWSDKSGNSAVNCLVLNGVAGNYASALDSNALDITGDIDLRVMCSLVDWSPSGSAVLISKDDNSTSRSYLFYVGTSGQLVLGRTTGGTSATYVEAKSSATDGGAALSTGITDLATSWVRATLAPATGKVNFYISVDGVNWAQIGVEQTITAGAIFSGTTEVRIGVFATVSPAAGNFYRAQIYNGIAGTLAFDANFATFSKLAATGTESSANAATVTINTTGATGARISGARDAFQGTAGFQPIYLPWSGGNYGYLNGSDGASFRTPDSAAISITGDIDLRALVAPTDYTPASKATLIGKWFTGATQSYTFGIRTDGKPELAWSTNGSNAVVATSTVATGLTDGTQKWLRVTLDVDNGASGYDCKFWLSDDNATWTQLGSTVVGVGTTSIADTASQLIVGAITDAGEKFIGNIYRAQVYAGIAGTLVFDFNPSAYTSGTTFLDSAGGATITLNGGSTIVTRSTLYFDGSNDYLKAAAFALAQPVSFYGALSQISWISADVIADGNAVDSMNFSQRNAGASPQLAIYAGAYVGNNSDLALQTRGIASAIYAGASSLLRINRGTPVTGNAGTASPNGLTIGATASGASNYANITASSVLLYSQAHDSNVQNRVIAYLARRWGIQV